MSDPILAVECDLSICGLAGVFMEFEGLYGREPSVLVVSAWETFDTVQVVIAERRSRGNLLEVTVDRSLKQDAWYLMGSGDVFWGSKGDW